MDPFCAGSNISNLAVLLVPPRQADAGCLRRVFSSWQCITELDERSLRLILGYIPAWVKFTEYERAR